MTSEQPSPGRNPGLRADDLLHGEMAAVMRAWIRQRRGSTTDWTMRTSELAGASIAAMVRATESGGHPATRGEFLALLRRVIDGVVVDRIRRAQVRRKGMAWLRAHAVDPASAPVPDDEAAEVVDRLFCTITPPEAELIRLVLEGRPWDEIAARMGVNNSVIRARWADLRTRLRTMVEAMLRERRN